MRLVVLCLALLLPFPVLAEDVALARLFRDQGVEGTIVIAALNEEQIFLHDEARAATRFSPASTFKIFNTLIGLEEKAVVEDEVFKWDGLHREFPGWDADQTLNSAFKVSCVWCYQEIARRVGAERYRHYVSIAHYGELARNFDVLTFWLDGSLRISALEQIAFLRALYQRRLPFSSKSYDLLRDVMLAERSDAYRLYAKTGWAARTTPQIGWHVGYVETARGVWLFATNISIRSQADLDKRPALTKAALRLAGIIP